MRSEYFANLDWVRLFLAIQVVYIHAGINEKVLISPVPAFLAVSGFAVYGSVQRWPVAQFFINRALRVLPLLFVSFAAVYWLFGPEEMVKTILFWVWPFGEPPVNAVVWSLIYEEFFYALLVVLFAVGAYKFKLFPMAAAAICFVLVATGTTLDLPPPFFLLGGAFFIGNCFYIFRERVEKVPPLVATAFLLAALYWVAQGQYAAIVRPHYVLADFISFAAVLTFGIAGPRLPKLPFDISYSLYLIHCIIRGVLLIYMPIGVTLFSFMLLSTIPVCVASWYLIERPALKIKHWRPALKAVPAE